MNRWLPIAMLMLCACGDRQERLAAEAIREGNSSYAAEQFDRAIDAYDRAAFDPRALHNSAKAAYRSRNMGEAVERSIATTEMPADSGLIADAFHDLGNSWMLRSREADSLSTGLDKDIAAIRMEGDDITGKVRLAVVRDSLRKEQQRNVQLSDSALTESVKAYRAALRRDPTDEDTRYNLALAQRSLDARKKERERKDREKKDQELSARARQLLEQADRLVEEYKFKEALDLLQRGLQEDPTLASKKEYIDKLDVVTKAAQAK